MMSEGEIHCHAAGNKVAFSPFDSRTLRKAPRISSVAILFTNLNNKIGPALSGDVLAKYCCHHHKCIRIKY